MDPVNASARSLSLAYDEYKKHPCMANQSLLMDCLDAFVRHFNSLEELMRADIFSNQLEE